MTLTYFMLWLSNMKLPMIVIGSAAIAMCVYAFVRSERRKKKLDYGSPEYEDHSNLQTWSLNFGTISAILMVVLLAVPRPDYQIEYRERRVEVPAANGPNEIADRHEEAFNNCMWYRPADGPAEAQAQFLATCNIQANQAAGIPDPSIQANQFQEIYRACNEQFIIVPEERREAFAPQQDLEVARIRNQRMETCRNVALQATTATRH